MNFREILVRKPFYEVMPQGYMQHRIITQGYHVREPEDRLRLKIKTPADFLREYYPSGHRINDPAIFPDVLKKDPESGKYFYQPVSRTAFAFQQIIATKWITHICGNDIQMELAGDSDDKQREEQDNKILATFRKGWLTKGMEVKMYEAFRSVAITADAAMLFYLDEEHKLGARVFSYIDGDRIYPHYKENSDTELELFARKYYDYDEDGLSTTEWVEVWDDKYMYKAKRGLAKSNTMQRIKEIFGLGGFEIVSKKEHGFNRCPVAYHRNDEGACWSYSQHTIEDFEEAFSYFFDNNKAFAFPIFYVKGDGVELKGDMNGAVKAVAIDDPDGEAGFLQHQDVSTSFNTELETLERLIYEQSFAVKPPELKAGDLPGVAVKLLYSPALELAMQNAHKFQPFLDTVIELFKYGYGLEADEQASFLTLPVNCWIEPYVHQNDGELFANLQMAVQNQFISKQTASERIPKYAKNDEFDRILREMKREQEMDLLAKLEEQDNQTDNNIRQTQAQGNAVIGERGARQTDENGNRPGENNWDRWNANH